MRCFPPGHILHRVYVIRKCGLHSRVERFDDQKAFCVGGLVLDYDNTTCILMHDTRLVAHFVVRQITYICSKQNKFKSTNCNMNAFNTAYI